MSDFFGPGYTKRGRQMQTFNFAEVEARTFASMMKDVNRMGDDDSFKRKDDIRDIDIRKLGNALARETEENILTEGVVKGVDIHKVQAAEIFDVPPAEVSKEMRAFAKCFTFRKLYGGNHAEVESFVTQAVAAARTRLNK